MANGHFTSLKNLVLFIKMMKSNLKEYKLNIDSLSSEKKLQSETKISGNLPIPHQEDRQESVPKRHRIGPSLGETMRTRFVEKLKQARVQRAGPYAGGRARARSIIEGAQEMFRTTDPNVALMEEFFMKKDI